MIHPNRLRYLRCQECRNTFTVGNDLQVAGLLCPACKESRDARRRARRAVAARRAPKQ